MTRKFEPWVRAFRSYAGWVPNVRSHLSFSLIGAAAGAQAFTQPIPGTSSRLVLLLQRRLVNDYPLWDWIASCLFPDIEVHWLLDARTSATDIPVRRDGELGIERDRQGMLEGALQLFPHQLTRALQKGCRRELAEVGQLLDTPRRLETAQEVRELREQARALAAPAGEHITISFALMRTGECRLWFENEVVGLSHEDHDWVAEQGYYFLKDAVHAHSHHDPTSDQITPLVRFDPQASGEGHEDEVAWRRETLWSLSREVERLNRRGVLVDQRRALGIIAYAEAFQSSLMSHVRDASAPLGFRKNATVHDFDFGHLKDSVKASIDVAATKLSQAVQMWIAGIATFISSVALVSSLVSTHNAALPRDGAGSIQGPIGLGLTDAVLPLMAWQPFVTGLFFSILLLGVISYFLVGGGAGLQNWAQRGLSQLARAFSVTVFHSPVKQFLLTLALHVVFVAGAAMLTLVLLRVIATGGSV